uniref:Uncharacterized protein n=1 Tax=Anguilla anguilla TaxID=7936 RepID=A0A0E9WJF3_ANGAN
MMLFPLYFTNSDNVFGHTTYSVHWPGIPIQDSTDM